uniref:Uncharacterized protein n=1 Tax=Oryza nivara TaxID=4536 RepID=A0A0E0HZ46_ORYNI
MRDHAQRRDVPVAAAGQRQQQGGCGAKRQRKDGGGMFVDKTVHRPTGSGRLRPGRGRGRPVEGADEALEEELASTAGGARQVGRIKPAKPDLAATILVLEEEGRRKWSWGKLAEVLADEVEGVRQKLASRAREASSWGLEVQAAGRLAGEVQNVPIGGIAAWRGRSLLQICLLDSRWTRRSAVWSVTQLTARVLPD